LAIRYPHVTKANRYAREIVSGRIPACIYVIQACQRHLDDLVKSKKLSYPYKFDKAKAEHVIKFAQMMPHIKGEKMNTLIILEPWQCFIFAVLFGWIQKANPDNRRFREFYGEIPRKNGKSVMGALIGNYMFSADSEPGSEVYAAATTQKQAYEVFRPAWLQTSKTPGYKNRFQISLGGTEENPGNIYSMGNGSRFEIVVGNPADGASPHCWLNDEYHEAKKADSYNTGKTGMGSRRNPLMITITTAGTNTSYPCYEKRNQVIKILSRKFINEEVFGIIYTLDKDDDWTDFKNWEKANPNMGVSVYREYFKSQLRTALQSPRDQNPIKCKNLNLWSNAGATWLSGPDWEKASSPDLDINDFKDEPAFVGLDLASKKDIASCMVIFKRDDHYYLFSRHYLPELRTIGEEFAHYAGWAHDEYIVVTPGNRIDIDYIQEDIEDLARNHDIAGSENGGGEICFDQYNTAQLIPKLENKQIACVDVGQNWQHLSEPMKEIEAAIIDGKFHHDGNPATTWMFENVTVFVDRNENIFPRKEGVENKIDGAVATITGMNRAMIEDSGSAISVYEDRGVLSL
jgi:phage terminase large subunit-like protein